MATDYFANCTDAAAAKKAYRRWSKELHPDKGGSAEAMAELNAQYERYQQRAKQQQQDKPREQPRKNKGNFGAGNSRFGFAYARYNTLTVEQVIAQLHEAQARIHTLEQSLADAKEECSEIYGLYFNARIACNDFATRMHHSLQDKDNLACKLKKQKAANDKLKARNAKLKDQLIKARETHAKPRKMPKV